jgi:glycosyltransferase involved in cell wall biosynthesis
MSTLAVSSSGATRRLRVCIVTETYPPEVNGVATTVGHLVSGLLSRGHSVQLIRPRQGRDDLPVRGGALEVFPQPGIAIPFYRQLKLGLPAGHALECLWRRTLPDLVHIVTEGLLGRSALTVSERLQLPVSSSFHTNFQSYSRYYKLGLLAIPIMAYLRRFHNRTAFTLVPTEDLAEQLQALGFQNLRILPRGVDTRLFSSARRCPALRQSWGAGADDPVLLYVGRLAAEKNLELAVAAFQTVIRRRPGARFVLVGDGPMARGLKARYPGLIFCGTRRGEELATHYASADVFVFPSLTETFGNVVLEAMASGLAVVAFDYAAARRHLEHERSGLRVSYGDAAAFVAAVERLSSAPLKVQELRTRASHAARRWDWSLVHRHLEAIFLELGK